MTTLTIDKAAVSQAPAQRTKARTKSPATNLVSFSSPLVSDEQRRQIDAELVELGAAKLRGTHATETVARKAIRVALREAGYEAADAREIAVEMVRACR